MTDIIVNHLYILFLRSCKTNAKCSHKKRKKFEVRNTATPKKYRFPIFVRLNYSFWKIALECKILISNPAEFVILTNRLNLV